MRIACCQLDAKSMDSAADVWPVVDARARAAVEAGAELLILPEIAYPSYLLESVERYWREDIDRSGVVLQRFGDLAARLGVWIVAGFVEERGRDLYNSAAVLDGKGRCVAIARKQFLWDCDNEWFRPGTDSLVVETPWGRMGILICADLRMPEIAATLIARGAEFIVQPTAWVNAALGTGGCRNIQAEFLVRARAMEFGVPFVCCSKSGRERSRMGYVGQSMIVDECGHTLDQAPIEGDANVIADITPKPGSVRRLSEDSVRALRTDPMPLLPTAPDRTITLDLSKGTNDICRQAEQEQVRVGRLGAEQLGTFVSARILALRQVQLIVAVGKAPDVALLRARAAENRVFLCVGESDAAPIVIGPTGEVIPFIGDGSMSVTFQPAEADVKCFTPSTPIWPQRRIDSYQFSVVD